MGEVWRAHDTETDRIVALKLLPPAFAEDEVFQVRFRREAHAAAGLIEPHVVPIHHYGEIDGRLYVDMRLIEGRDLKSVIEDAGPLEPARAVMIIEQVGAALNAAHKSGLVVGVSHRAGRFQRSQPPRFTALDESHIHLRQPSMSPGEWGPRGAR